MLLRVAPANIYLVFKTSTLIFLSFGRNTRPNHSYFMFILIYHLSLFFFYFYILNAYFCKSIQIVHNGYYVCFIRYTYLL